ncbi:MAG: hypothetical protein EHM64_09185 [Ignavibacteriae bacterium]|nr:MAG: hypothetical protein EHM64_09185 [Ignavibacteriota bacterium]
MRTVLFSVLTLLGSTQIHSQPGMASRVDFALYRIEQAFRTGDPGSVEDLIPSGIIMRIEDSLYQGIPGREALSRLQEFFANKDSIDFRFVLPGQGTMIYSSGGKRDSIQVDVWLKREYGEVFVYAINISNEPVATVFFNIPRDKSKTVN